MSSALWSSPLLLQCTYLSIAQVHRAPQQAGARSLVSGSCLLMYSSHYSAALCCQVFEILLSRGYSENTFREDLKNLYLKLGIENKKMIFLFTDAHVAEEGFLELINNMLTSGMGRLETHWLLLTYKRDPRGIPS